MRRKTSPLAHLIASRGAGRDVLCCDCELGGDGLVTRRRRSVDSSQHAAGTTCDDDLCLLRVHINLRPDAPGRSGGAAFILATNTTKTSTRPISEITWQPDDFSSARQPASSFARSFARSLCRRRRAQDVRRRKQSREHSPAALRRRLRATLIDGQARPIDCCNRECARVVESSWLSWQRRQQQTTSLTFSRKDRREDTRTRPGHCDRESSREHGPRPARNAKRRPEGNSAPAPLVTARTLETGRPQVRPMHWRATKRV
jgi:hypothetical protein